MTVKTPYCYHCNTICDAGIIQFDKKEFCCEGCKTVFEIINSSGLEDFYCIAESPGIKSEIKGDFEILDNPEVQSKILLFDSLDKSRVIFRIPKIHCASCIYLLEQLSKINSGILQSTVNFFKKEVSILYNKNEITLKELALLLNRIGYTPEITYDDLSAKKPQNYLNRRLIIQLGVVGFCFGNIMFLSLPQYFNVFLSIEGFENFLGILKIMLCLPVFFYGASDYLVSAYKALSNKNINLDVPISLGIISLFSLTIIEISILNKEGYADSFCGLLFFLILGKYFQQITYKNLSFDKDYKSFFPLSITKIDENGLKASASLDQLEKGDLIFVKKGELIPSDGILSSEITQIDYSFVTGEADPVRCNKGEKIFAGGRIFGEPAQVVLTSNVKTSYLAELWEQLSPGNSKRDQLELLINKLGLYFTLAVITIALSAFVFWWIKDHDFAKAIFVLTSVLIVACPCALAISMPFTLGNGLRLFKNKNVFLKDIKAILSIAKVDTIVFDKTGTLTNSTLSTVSWQGNTLSQKEKEWIYKASKSSNHPYSIKVSEYLSKEVILNDNEISGKVHEEIGAGVHYLEGGNNIKIGSTKFCGSQLLMDESNVVVSINGEVKGAFIIQSQYRKGIEELFKSLTNFKTIILSGDKKIKEEEIKQFASNSELVFEQSPHDKLNFIRSKQSSGHSILMIGDGLNDAGALMESDCGLALVENNGTFTPASDGIISGDTILRIPNIIRFSKVLYKIVWVNFTISFLYNIVGLSFAVMGKLSPIASAILMPVSSFTVIGVSLLASYYFYKRYFDKAKKL